MENVTPLTCSPANTENVVAFPPPNPGGAEPTLKELVQHAESVPAQMTLADVHRRFQNSREDFFAIVDARRVIGLCTRATVGFMLGSRYGFALYGSSPVTTALAAHPLIFPETTAVREVLDRALSRTGAEFFEDVVLIDADGALVGLIPVPSLARLQLRLFGEQLGRVVQQDDELRQQNLELFQINHQLRQSQGRYNALFDNNALGVALLDAGGLILAHNRRFEQVMRLGARPLPSVLCLENCVAASERPALKLMLTELERHAPHTKPQLAELTFDLPDGLRTIELHLSWVGETGQICAFFEDTTEQRMLEKRMAQQEKQNMLDTLVAGVAHELNNKLTPVLGFADLLHATAPEGTQAHARYIRQSTLEAAGIIRQLLNLSKPVSDANQRVDLTEMIHEAMGMLRFQIREAGAHLSLDVPDETVLAEGDSAQLKQVLINLVLNALHAMEGRPEVLLAVTLRTRGGSAIVQVRDIGVGIAPQNLQRIFNPFFTTKGPRGTGLGLSISASIVRQYGGDITVESELGKGSVFSVRLPLPAAGSPASAVREANDLSAPWTQNARDGRGRVLVVDDEEFVRQFLQEALRTGFGCRVDSAEDGEVAIGQIQAEQYDLIISDIRMPRRNGFELFEWLKQHRPELARRFIFITGHAGQMDLDRSLDGMDCPVMRKPFTLEGILTACRRYLGDQDQA